MKRRHLHVRVWFWLMLAALPFDSAPAGEPLPVADGYRGIWYAVQPTNDEYRFKYSGGMATYPQQHAPIAIYRPEVDKTFFVYGGTTANNTDDPQQLLHMVSCFDHRMNRLANPRILLNKQTSDAHDNPVLSIDDDGYLWVFSPSHGTGRPSYIHRSVRPYDISEFDRLVETNFSYAQPWWISGQGFLFLQTRYGGRELPVHAPRTLCWQTSRDGRDWSAAQALAAIDQGDYQISWAAGNRIATACDYHPAPLGLNGRTNIYYLESSNFGRSWTTAAGREISLPLTEKTNEALILDAQNEGKLVYLKDLNFDPSGHPVLLFLTSAGFEPGPAGGTREWQTLRWTGSEWDRRPFTTSDNNYDHGSLEIDAEGTWRVVAPTETGPQAGNPGGEMVLWISCDQGESWDRVRQLTRSSPRNHSYARRPLNAHPDFATLWADGDGRRPSLSALYFTDRDGKQVWRMPAHMSGDWGAPEPVE